MARRKEFKSIANGLLSSFISRNNDVYGYWGIGKLYSHMLKSKTMILEIDLVNSSVVPNDNEFELLIKSFSDRLMTQMEKRGLNPQNLISAKIILTGYPKDRPSTAYAPNKINCDFIITDDLGKIHQTIENVWCRKHSRWKESKSTRKY